MAHQGKVLRNRGNVLRVTCLVFGVTWYTHYVQYRSLILTMYSKEVSYSLCTVPVVSYSLCTVQ